MLHSVNLSSTPPSPPPPPPPPPPTTHTHTHTRVQCGQKWSSCYHWQMVVGSEEQESLQDSQGGHLCRCKTLFDFCLYVHYQSENHHFNEIWETIAQGGCRWIGYHMAPLKCSVRNGLFKSSWCLELAEKTLLEIMLLCLYSLWPRSIHWLEKSYANWVRPKLSF